MKAALKKFLVFLTAGSIALGAPVVPAEEVEWHYSYGTMEFSTPSGNLRKRDYAWIDGELFVNKNGAPFKVDDPSTVNLRRLKEQTVVGTRYYDVYADGTEYKSNKDDYKRLDDPDQSKRRRPRKRIRRSIISSRRAQAAIANEASTQVDSSGYVNSLTFSINCSGTDRGLMSFLANRVVSDITGVTHNGDAMTDEGESNNINVAGVRGYSLINPDTGSQNIVYSLSGYKLLSTYSICLSGVDQTDMVEAVEETATGYSSSISDSITTLTDDAWIIAAINLQSAYALTPDSGETELNDTDHSDGNLGQFGVSYYEKATAGAETMGWSWSSGDNYALTLFAIKPAAGAGGSSRRILFVQ